MRNSDNKKPESSRLSDSSRVPKSSQSLWRNTYILDGGSMGWDDMAKLQANWDSYGAPPINPDCIYKARRLLGVLPPEWDWQCVPLSSGGVQIESHRDGFDIEISIEAAVKTS